jgi:hypothetical protein
MSRVKRIWGSQQEASTRGLKAKKCSHRRRTGVFNLGTFFLDAASIILGNAASTSNDNVFGPVTPL